MTLGLLARTLPQHLGTKTPQKAIRDHVDEQDKAGWRITTQFGEKETTIINESGLYSLIFSSKLEGAQRFKHWVTHEVLPSIRKHGMYMTYNLLETAIANPDFVIGLIQNMKAEKEKSAALQMQNKQLCEKNEEMQPKVIFADAVETSSTSVLIGDFAKLLKQNGIDIGQTRLFEWMRNNGYLMRVKGERRNMPTQRSMEMKLFEIKESIIEHKDGHLTIIRTPKVTGKGQIYFANKFLQDKFLQDKFLQE